MARYSIGRLASLTILCVAGAVPLQAQDYAPPSPACPCPPGQQQDYFFPPATPGDMQPGSSTLPDAPGQPSNGSQQPFDRSINTQQPAMARPTFNPSSNPSSAGPTTAATSAEATAPNMIGDLFGTSFSGPVPIVIDNFFAIPNMALNGPEIDPMSAAALTVSSMAPHPDLMISSSINGALMSTTPMFPLSFTTVDSQSNIATANPVLTGAIVPIVNNAAVQTEVDTFASSIHGPGSTVFDPNASTVLLGAGMGMPVVTRDYNPAWSYNYVVQSEVSGLSNPGGAPGSMVGRQKITENSSPLPRDRVFLNYSYFNNTPLLSSGVNVNRVTPGFEKTLFGGDFSVEVRAPFATTLDSDVVAGGLLDTSSAELGNLTVYFKALLWNAGCEAVSAGVGLTFPTADDVNVTLANGTPLLNIENESIHILPFIGALFMPTERMFVQSFLQADIDPNGNSVRFSQFPNGVPNGVLTTIGRPNDADYIFFDIGLGFWLYQAPTGGACCCEQCSSGCGCGWIRGIAPTVELHYNATFNEADTVSAARGPSTIRFGDSRRSEIDLWNVVLGVTVACKHNANLTIAYAAPIEGDEDQQFDSELRVVFNWFFGGRNGARNSLIPTF